MEYSAETLDNLTHLVITFYEKISCWECSAVRGSGLTPAQMHAIEIIGQEKSLRMKDLALKLGVTTGTLTVTVDKLESLGYLVRRQHEKDRRSLKVLLTPKGRRHFAKHLQDHRTLSEEIVADLSAEEVNAFVAGLEKINNNF